MPTSRSATRRALVWLLLAGLVLPLRALADGADDFGGAVKDSSKWGEDIALAAGVLTQTNGRLEYTCDTPLSDGDTFRPWNLTKFPADRDWDIRIDAFNGTVPDLEFEVNSAGLVLLHPTLPDSEINIELYASSLGFADSVRKGFDADLDTGDVRIGDVDSGGLVAEAAVNGALRIAYAGATRSSPATTTSTSLTGTSGPSSRPSAWPARAAPTATPTGRWRPSISSRCTPTAIPAA